MNLHEWITERVEMVEAGHRPVIVFPESGGEPIVGAVTDAKYMADGFELTVAPGLTPATAVLRRCEADRRILARHKLDPAVTYEPACEGCGTYGDMGMSTTDNLNECPELLDLAHAHGITEAELAALDRPEPPPRIAGPVVGYAHITPVITTDQVPEALRGTRWGRRH